jgi:hypothetical protein
LNSFIACRTSVRGTPFSSRNLGVGRLSASGRIAFTAKVPQRLQVNSALSLEATCAMDIATFSSSQMGQFCGSMTEFAFSRVRGISFQFHGNYAAFKRCAPEGRPGAAELQIFHRSSVEAPTPRNRSVAEPLRHDGVRGASPTTVKVSSRPAQPPRRVDTLDAAAASKRGLRRQYPPRIRAPPRKGPLPPCGQIHNICGSDPLSALDARSARLNFLFTF